MIRILTLFALCNSAIGNIINKEQNNDNMDHTMCAHESKHSNISEEICYEFSNNLVRGPYVCEQYEKYIQVPIDQALDELKISYRYSRYSNIDVWIPVVRNVTFEFNPMVYFEITDHYGQNYSLLNIYQNSSLLNQHCIRLRDSIRQLSSCDEKAIGICAYRKDPYEEDYGSHSYKLINLQMHFDNHNKFIILEVSPLNSLKNIYNRNVNVFCFTNAHNSLIERLNEHDFEIQHKSKEKIVYHIKNLSLDPSYYWCEAFNVRFNISRSSKIVAYAENYGNEFVIHANVSFEILPTIYISHYIENLKELLNITIVRNIRIMRMYIITSNIAKVIFHVTTHSWSNSTLENEFEQIKIRLDLHYPQNDTIAEIKNIETLLCSKACLPHTTLSGSMMLTWPLTLLDETTVSNELCFHDQEPITRQCIGSFLEGAWWSKVNGICNNNYTNTSPVTDTLFELYHSNASAEVVIQNVTEVVTDVKEHFKPIDVYFVAQICKKVYNDVSDKTLLNQTVTLVNNLMDAEKSTLQLSQKQLNATDSLLNIMDTTLATFNLADHNKEYLHILRSNVMSLAVDLFKSNIRGIALFSQRHNNIAIAYKYIYSSTNVDKLLELDGLDVAAYISEELMRHLIDLENFKNIRLIITVFYKDILFNEDVDEERQSVGKIVSVTLDGFFGPLPRPIQILFRPNKKYANQMVCAFWNFGKNEDLGSFKGSWKIEKFSKETENDKRICEFDHLTHFSLLVVGKTEEHVEILNIITGIGSILSVLGILGIFVTALVFKSWRNNVGHKILLQFSVTNILKIIFLYLAGMEKFQLDLEDIRTKQDCALLGMVLHYTILAEFFWMLIIAYLQFRRFVLVLCPEIPHLILKTTLLGWGVPMIPVAIVYFSSTNSYISNQQICYPYGLSLYLGLLLPISLIIFSNITIFIWIIASVTCTKIKSFSNKSQDHSAAIINLSILLFFLLGLSWIFGFVAALDNGVVGILFSYLFCFSAPLQGLVSFLYFIILNDATKKMWYSFMSVPLLKKCMKAKLTLKKYKFSDTSDYEQTDDTYDVSFSREEINTNKY